MSEIDNSTKNLNDVLTTLKNEGVIDSFKVYDATFIVEINGAVNTLFREGLDQLITLHKVVRINTHSNKTIIQMRVECD